MDLISSLDSAFDRIKEVPIEGIFCDLLWSDPVEDVDVAIAEEFSPNYERECSFFYGRAATKRLLEKNKLTCILRGHQVMIEGYKMHKWADKSVKTVSFPPVVTIFSAPNYCGTYDNKGAYFILNDGRVEIKTYNETLAPYRLPDNLNVLTWSIPFVADRIL